MAQVYVNGMLAGTTGSITNIAVAFQAQSELKSFDLTPFLVSGTNTIEVCGAERPGFLRRRHRRRLPAKHGGGRFRRHAELPVCARAFQRCPSRPGRLSPLALYPQKTREVKRVNLDLPTDCVAPTADVNPLTDRGCGQSRLNLRARCSPPPNARSAAGVPDWRTLVSDSRFSARERRRATDLSGGRG